MNEKIIEERFMNKKIIIGMGAVIVALAAILIIVLLGGQKPAHEHSWDEWQISKQATCIVDGLQTRVCDGCDESQSITISATGHQYSEWSTTKEATCTENGTKEKSCDCGDKKTETIVSAHSWKEATCIAAKTCEKCNLTEGSALGHTCVTGTCTRCNKKVEPVVHLPSAPLTVWFHSSSKMKITELSYRFDNDGDLIISFSGEKTYGGDGSYIALRYKVVDNEGYTVETGMWTGRGYNVGDKFKNETLSVSASKIKGLSEFTIIIEDYK